MMPPTSSAAPPAPLPRALIHVGPHKTASTLLQAGLLRHAHSLDTDGFALALSTRMLPGPHGGPKAGANLAHFLQGRVTNGSAAVWPAFTAFVADARRRRRGIILSAEDLDQGPSGWPGRPPSPVDIPRLLRALRGFHITVLVAYRPFADWVASVHAETFLATRTPGMPGAWGSHFDTLAQPVTQATAKTIMDRAMVSA